MSWNAGYVSEIGYTYGYYRELSPGLLRLACLSAGFAPPTAGPLRYLELGYGQGLSINIHAAAITGEFWGTDFIPSQAAHAQSLAEASRSGAVLLDNSFSELADRSDLPEFDVIALHGTWSWVSDENRRVIVDIVRRRLRVGGLLYLSYNCLPGWTTAMPLRHLMTLHAELAGSGSAGITGKIDNAVAFTQSVADAGAFYFRVNTVAADRLKTIAGQVRAYLAHVFFNRDGAVMPFSDVVRSLDDA
jgi:SAM-dependent methyltransferase